MTDQAAAPEKKRAFDTFEVVVEESRVLSDRNKDIRFRVPADKPFNFKSGQFVQIFVPLPDGKVKRTSYSIASPPQRHEVFDLCVTHVEGGVSSTFLHNLKAGDKVKVMGPLGTFTLPQPLPRDPVFIATGSGIAPFRAMIGDLLANNTPKTIYLIFGNRYDNDTLYQKEWEDLAKAKNNFKLYLTLSRPDKWTGPKGYVQEGIEKFVPLPAHKDFFICGLTKMINDVHDKLISLGVPKEQIHYERYD